METYLVEYVTDRTLTIHTMLVSADDYSKAYLNAVFALPREATITEMFKI
jgi:hypothetical protein